MVSEMALALVSQGSQSQGDRPVPRQWQSIMARDGLGKLRELGEARRGT